MSETSIIPVQAGFWGEWQEPVIIPDGYLIRGMQVRFEGSQGGGDDTALNGLKLLCEDIYHPQDTREVIVHEGFWGAWRNPVYVPDNCYVVGVATRIEARQGTGDDTALNGIKMIYRNRVTLQVGIITLEDGIWGSWAGEASVPDDSLVCGVQIRIESPQRDGDDTAMNGINLVSRKIPSLGIR